jgi:hypothetical protein
VKAIKHYAKPHHVVDLAGYIGMPYANPISTGLKMVGMGKQRGCGDTFLFNRDDRKKTGRHRIEHKKTAEADQHFMDLNQPLDGLGRRHRRRHQHGRGILTPNSSDFGGVKF